MDIDSDTDAGRLEAWDWVRKRAQPLIAAGVQDLPDQLAVLVQTLKAKRPDLFAKDAGEVEVK